jgi:hypothetical protein
VAISTFYLPRNMATLGHFFKTNLSVQESDPCLLDAKWQNSATKEKLAFSHFCKTYFSLSLFVIFYELSGQEGSRPTDHILHPNSK